VGFGVKNAETAANIGRLAEGVVIGSALVSQIEAAKDDTAKALSEIEALISSIRTALDAVQSPSA